MSAWPRLARRENEPPAHACDQTQQRRRTGAHAVHTGRSTMSKSKRRIVMFNQVSADGYFAAPDGKLDWVVQEPEVHKAATQSMRQVDTMLFGRKTYENFEAFWPHALDDSK